jgi:hypothetical protein
MVKLNEARAFFECLFGVCEIPYGRKNKSEYVITHLDAALGTIDTDKNLLIYNLDCLGKKEKEDLLYICEYIINCSKQIKKHVEKNKDENLPFL